MVSSRFETGRLLVHRHFTMRDLVFTPLTRVVSDDDRGLLLWMPHGTPVQREVTLDGRGPRAMPFAEWLAEPKQIVADVHRGPNILKLIPPTEELPEELSVTHSVWWIFGLGGSFAAWYVNLEKPSVRWDDGDLAGIDTTDYDLDIWVSPDRTWRWKDEHELEERLGFPDQYWVTDPESVRAEGLRVIPRIEAGAFPFDGTWMDFQPDPLWTVPVAMPLGWDRPRAG